MYNNAILFSEGPYFVPISYDAEIRISSNKMRSFLSHIEIDFDVTVLKSLFNTGKTLRTLDDIYVEQIQAAKGRYLFRIASIYEKCINNGKSANKTVETLTQEGMPEAEMKIALQAFVIPTDPFFYNPDDKRYSTVEKVNFFSTNAEVNYYIGALTRSKELTTDPVQEYLKDRQDTESMFQSRMAQMKQSYAQSLEKGKTYEYAYRYAVRDIFHRQRKELSVRKSDTRFTFNMNLAQLTIASERIKINLLNIFSSKQKAISQSLKLAKKTGQLPCQLTDEEINSCELLAADMNANELNEAAAREEEQRLKSQPIKACGNKKKKKKPEPKKVVIASSAQHHPDSAEDSLFFDSFKTEFSLALSGHSNCFKNDPRVTIWNTATIEEIRQFQNKEGLFTYKGQSDEKIEKHRLHHTLPNMGQILSDKKNRAIYSFPIKTGLGMAIILIANDQVTQGIIYLGIDRNNKKEIVYHNQFVEKSFDNISSLFKADSLSFLNKIAEAEAEEDRKDNEDQQPFELNAKLGYEMLSDGVISVVNPKKPGIKILLLPVRTDLLDKRFCVAL